MSRLAKADQPKKDDASAEEVLAIAGLSSMQNAVTSLTLTQRGDLEIARLQVIGHPVPDRQHVESDAGASQGEGVAHRELAQRGVVHAVLLSPRPSLGDQVELRQRSVLH